MNSYSRFEHFDAALGREPADVIIQNGQILNVYTGELLPGDIAIKGNRIIGVTYGEKSVYQSDHKIDASGKYIVPGFIDPHIHIESSAVTLTEFTKAVLPLGITSIAEDAHEIANVVGINGIEVLVEESKELPINLFLRVPGRVPATDEKNETSGGSLTVEQTTELLEREESVCLAGDINPYLVINNDKNQIEKIKATMMLGKTVSGQIAGDLSEMEINAMAMAGLEDSHIAESADFMIYLNRNGIRVLITHRQDLFPVECYKDLAEIIEDYSINTRLMSFCTDDVFPNLLLSEGHLNDRIYQAIKAGIPVIDAYQMATINTAEFLRIDRDYGSVNPGKIADILILDDLEEVSVDQVLYHGRVVVSDKVMCDLPDEYAYPKSFYETINTNKEFSAADFKLQVLDVPERVSANVMTSHIPRHLEEKELATSQGVVLPDVENDIACISVIDRHSGSNRVSHGFLGGFGIRHGAVASTVNHDAHNMVVIGQDFDDMAFAANKLKETGGGMVAVLDEDIISLVELPICGIMSDQPMPVVAAKYESFETTVKNVLGVSVSSPIESLVFMCLPNMLFYAVTDKGLLDTQTYEILDVISD